MLIDIFMLKFELPNKERPFEVIFGFCLEYKISKSE